MLDRITFTGADDSTSLNEMLNISLQYPFVEWGILVSEKNTPGCARFPSRRWFTDLQGLAETTGVMKLSLHVCGRWVRDLLMGVTSLPFDMLSCFQRVQLNFHAERTRCDPQALHEVLRGLNARQFIFQIDGANGNKHLESLYAQNGVFGIVDAVPLFDVSGGAGVVPSEWPKPQYMETDSRHVYHGYAGGLGPHNIATELPRILQASGDTRIWIDMESHVRGPESTFRLDKCVQVIEAVQNQTSVLVS